MPVPFFAFRTIYDEVARAEWDSPLGRLPPFAFADRAKIVAALAHPFATEGGRDLYPTVRWKAAALFRGLVKNHGLRDGNKRLAVTTMSVFLLANGWVPTYTNRELYRYARRVARKQGNYPVANIATWISRHTVLMSDDDLETARNQNRRLLVDEHALLVSAFNQDLEMPSRRT